MFPNHSKWKILIKTIPLFLFIYYSSSSTLTLKVVSITYKTPMLVFLIIPDGPSRFPLLLEQKISHYMMKLKVGRSHWCFFWEKSHEQPVSYGQVNHRSAIAMYYFATNPWSFVGLLACLEFASFE